MLEHVERLVLISGPMAAGKTTLRDCLVLNHDFDYVRSSLFLADKARREGLPEDRRGLQELGDRLDAETDYRWIVDDVALPAVLAQPEKTRWLVDAVRKSRQVDHFRSVVGSARVIHLHLTAPEELLRARYQERRFRGGASAFSPPYDIAIAHANEVASRELVHIADVVCDVSTTTPQEIAKRVLS